LQSWRERPLSQLEFHSIVSDLRFDTVFDGHAANPHREPIFIASDNLLAAPRDDCARHAVPGAPSIAP
jgi:hypothetical protein